jgi:hypothetical protein
MMLGVEKSNPVDFDTIILRDDHLEPKPWLQCRPLHHLKTHKLSAAYGFEIGNELSRK